MKTTRKENSVEKKLWPVPVVTRKLLKIRENFRKEWKDGGYHLLMWAGGGVGALSFKSPEAMAETPIVVAIARRVLREVNPDFVISELSCQNTSAISSLQFSYRKVNHRDQ